MRTPPTMELLTVADLAAALRVKPATVRRMRTPGPSAASALAEPPAARCRTETYTGRRSAHPAQARALCSRSVRSLRSSGTRGAAAAAAVLLPSDGLEDLEVIGGARGLDVLRGFEDFALPPEVLLAFSGRAFLAAAFETVVAAEFSVGGLLEWRLSLRHGRDLRSEERRALGRLLASQQRAGSRRCVLRQGAGGLIAPSPS